MEIEVIDSEKFRKYLIKDLDGQEFTYPSVSSITSQLSAIGLKFWIKKVGTEVAKNISEKAQLRGTRVHLLIENYLKLNIKPELDNEDYLMFSNMTKYIDKIKNIVMQEEVVFSHKLKLAGRVDCIAFYDDILSIIDFKTACKKKTKKTIEQYFIQCACYAYCYNEMFPEREKINQLVLIIGVDDPIIQSQLITSTLDEYKTSVEHYRNNFRKTHNI
jgi:hypothetical protein